VRKVLFPPSYLIAWTRRDLCKDVVICCASRSCIW